MNSRLKGHLCYVAGPINANVDFMSWRNDMSRFLWNLGIGVLNPCDKPLDHNEDENFQNNLVRLRQEEKYDEITDIMREIVTIDLHFVDLSSFVILYIDKNSHMCGSYAEMTYSCLERKPLIVICEQGKTNIPAWLFGHAKHTTFFNTFDQAKEYIRHIHEDNDIENINRRWKFLDFDKVFGKHCGYTGDR